MKKFSLRPGFFISLLLCAALFASDMLSLPAAAAEPQTVTFVAVGDDLIHSQIYKACKKNSKYNFDSLFKNVRSEIQAADLAAINQETILVDSRYSGYPSFGSPKSLADAIAKAGFDIVTHATNHTLDRGTSSIKGTLKYWNSKHPDIRVLGIHKSKKDASKITTIEKNGIKISMLNYTYGLNGYKLPSGKGYMIDRLSDKSKIKKDIKKARKQGDFVIVFAHFGTEYKYTPDSSQKNWAKFFAEQGVDLLVGTHPHVVEPYKMVKGKNGHKMLAYYSLGNFVSAQKRVPRLLGGMAKVTIIKDSKGARVQDYTMEPLVTHIGKGYKSFTVYKLSDYTDALAKKNQIRKASPKESFSVKKLKSLFKKITKK